MKIAHVADCHFGLGYPGPTPSSRFEDIRRTMDWVADRIIAEGCELVLFAGDAFKDARVFIDRATVEIAAFVAWLRKLSSHGTHVVVISGTPSHDAISAYRLIAEMRIPRVDIFTEPCVADVDGLWIACLPGMNRSNFATREEFAGLPPHVFHARMTNWITERCREMSQTCKILVSHLTYDLADTGFEDALMQNEPILTEEAAKMFELVCLGHIHRPQQAGNVFYSGAPERLNFGEEKVTPGFWIHEHEGNRWAHRFIETPARRFETIIWTEQDVEAFLSGERFAPGEYQDVIVRLHYSCSEDVNKQVDRRVLEQVLYDAGAFYIHEIRADLQRVDRVRDEEVTESLTPVQAVTHWGEIQGLDQNEISALQAMTAALMEEIAV